MKRERLRIAFARFLDRHLGRALIYLWALRQPAVRETAATKRVRRILFIKLWGMGSVILTQPALEQLRRLHPGAPIHYLTFERNRRLFELMPVADRVFTLAFGSLGAFLSETLSLISRLRKEKYDLIIDAEFLSNFSTLMARAAAPGARIAGFGRKQHSRSRLLNVTVDFDSSRHVRDLFVDLARQASGGGGHYESPRLALPLKRHDEGRATPWGAGNRPFFILNVNAGPLALERRWPRRSFIELSRCLLERFSASVVLIGSSSEREYVAPVAAALRRRAEVVDLCGRLTLTRLAFLMGKSALVISNDSGPLHLAAALRVPLVGFFGPESPGHYGPLGDRQLILYRGLSCSPCMSIANAKVVQCGIGVRCLRGLQSRPVAASVTDFILRNGLLPQRLLEPSDGLQPLLVPLGRGETANLAAVATKSLSSEPGTSPP